MYKVLAVLSNGESQALTVSSEGYYDIRLSTQRIEFPLVAQNTGGNKFILVNGDRNMFDINSIKIPTDKPYWLQLSVAKIENNTIEAPMALNGYKKTNLCPVAKVELLIKPGAPLGRFSELFKFDITGKTKQKRELILNCMGEIVPEVSSLPERLIMLDQKENGWEQIIIRGVNTPFRIKAVESKYMEFDYVKSEKPTLTSKIKVRKKSDNISIDKDCISVYLEHPTITKLNIPVLFLFNSS